MPSSPEEPIDYDTVELRAGRLHKIRRSEARLVDSDELMAPVAKCYCRSLDVLTQTEVEQQRRPSFVFPIRYFRQLEGLIGRELQGRLYQDSARSRVRFYLDLKEHAGFQPEPGTLDLASPWYDESCLKE